MIIDIQGKKDSVVFEFNTGRIQVFLAFEDHKSCHFQLWKILYFVQVIVDC